MDTLQHDLPNIESQIPPIHEQFTILEKYEVPVPDNVSSSSCLVPPSWTHISGSRLWGTVVLSGGSIEKERRKRLKIQPLRVKLIQMVFLFNL